MRRLSLRARVVAGLMTVAVVLLVAAAAITATTRGQLMEQIDERLRAAAEPGRGRGIGAPPPPRATGDGTEPPATERLSEVFEGVLTAEGDLIVVFASNMPDRMFSAPALNHPEASTNVGETFTVDAVDGDVRYRVITSPMGAEFFVQAIPLDEVDDTIDRLIVFEAVGAAIVLVALGAVGWWVVHLGVRPIKQMTDAAHEIAAGDLSVRVGEQAAAGTEAGVLARALDSMLGRIESAVDDQARSEERLRRFVADASHELRTPVTTIRGYAELYHQGGLANQGALDDAMRRTRLEADRMGRLVEDMLTLAELDAERPLDLAPVDIGTVIADTVADAAIRSPQHRFEASVEGDVSLEADEDRIRQVLVNLVANATAHTPPGTDVSVRARRNETSVVVEVRDAGPGMDDESVVRVTERFFRADKARARASGGSGLGLSIADGIVAAHGGALELTSVPDEGTTVTVTLPC